MVSASLSSRGQASAQVPVPAAGPPPPSDVAFTVEELAAAAGVTVRTVRYYIEQKALPAPEFRSWNTRYDRDCLVRLRAIAGLRKRKLRLPAIRQQLAAATADELLRLAGYAPAAPPAAPATATATTTTPAAGASTTAADPATATATTTTAPADAPARRSPPAGFVGPYRAGTAYPSERWEHQEICPGVKLLVRTEADAEAWRVAREILALFGTASG